MGRSRSSGSAGGANLEQETTPPSQETYSGRKVTSNHYHHHHPIVATARRSILALANLSEREKSRVRTTLRNHTPPSDGDGGHYMLDLQLELALSSTHDNAIVEAAYFIVQHLSQVSRAATVRRPMMVSRGVTTSMAATTTSYTAGNAVSLSQLLEERPVLLKCALEKIHHELGRMRSEKQSIANGRFSICLRALGLLFYKVSMDRIVRGKDSAVTTFLNCAAELVSWIQLLRIETAQKEACLESHLDRAYRLLLCAAFVMTSSALPAIVDTDSGTTQSSTVLVSTVPEVSKRTAVPAELEACAQLLQLASTVSGLSHQCETLLGRFASAIVHHSDPSSILDEVLVFGCSAPYDSEPTSAKEDDLWMKACSWIASNVPCDFEKLYTRGTDWEAFVADPAAGLLLVKDLYVHEHFQVALSHVHEVLKMVLQSTLHAKAFAQNDKVTCFIEQATDALFEMDGPNLPLVSPVSIEMMARIVDFSGVTKLQEHESRFLLCLLYCFIVRGLSPDPMGPFIFVPRELPLCEIRIACDTRGSEEVSPLLRLRLIQYIDSTCPEIASRARLRNVLSPIKPALVGHGTREKGIITEKGFVRDLLACIQQPTLDTAGALAEQLFIAAKAQLPEPVLIASSIRALMAEPHVPLRYLSYSSLCNDPLMLLKCPASLLKRKSIRRIVIWLLGSLLETNENVVRVFTNHDDSRQELFDSRDALVLRCLASMLTSFSSKDLNSLEGSYCTNSISLVRKIVSKRRGVFAILLKQGISEAELDWFVDWVPEVIEDAVAIGGILTERSSLTTVDRLVAADGVVRVAVAHGHRYPDESKLLVYAALSHLIASFFLVVGPVGVSVSSVVVNGLGDATEISRKAAFRILKALLRVDSYRSHVKSECALALQKLVGLCKGEAIISSLPNAVASRQKSLMKELLDAIVRAANAMGTGLQI